MSSSRNTIVRSMHDLGAAAWFGGSLMGAVGLNGASADVADVQDRIRVSSLGWARWSPVAVGAIGAHVVGGAGLILAHRDRVRDQSGVTANTVVKTLLTAAAVSTTAYSGVLGARLGRTDRVSADSGTKPSKTTPNTIATLQQQLRVLQWATPVLTGIIVVLGAQQGEQQRPDEYVKGIGKKGAKRSTNLANVVEPEDDAFLAGFDREGHVPA